MSIRETCDSVKATLFGELLEGFEKINNNDKYTNLMNEVDEVYFPDDNTLRAFYDYFN